MAEDLRSFGAISGVYRRRLVCLFAIVSLFTIHSPLATVVYAADPGVEFGAEDDLTVLGVQGGAADPDVEVKGFSVFGATQTSYPGIVSGPGNMAVNGYLSVSSGAYFAANSTFTVISAGSITTSGAGVIFSTNVFVTSGNVGIGTANPGDKLQVENTGGAVAVSVKAAAATSPFFDLYNGANYWRMFQGGSVSGSANKLHWSYNSNTPLVTIDTGGNVGIGTTGPTARLDVEGTTSDINQGIVKIYDTAAMAADIGGYITLGGKYTAVGGMADWAGVKGGKENATDGNYAGYLAFMTRVNSSNMSEKVRITSGGNVGIGTTGPVNSLTIGSGLNAAAAGAALGVKGSITAQSDTGILLRDTAWTRTLQIFQNSTNSNIQSDGPLALNPTSGNVGIGTTSPGYDSSGWGVSSRYLTVLGPGTAGNVALVQIGRGISADDEGIGVLDFINTSNTGAAGAGRYGVAQIRAINDDASGAGGDSGAHMAFMTKADAGSTAERMRITSAGDVGIGTTNPGARFQVSGGTTVLEQEVWQTPALQNSWANYGNGYNPAGYFKDSTGVVHLRGLLQSGTVGACAFTLPAGYRPPNTEIVSTLTYNNAIGRVEVLNTGCVQASSVSNVWFSLDNITFRAN